MTQQPSTSLPWDMEIGEKHCFHDGNRVSIFSRLPDREYPSEAIYQTIAEIWPGDDDVDIKDGNFIMTACHCHKDLLTALEYMVFAQSQPFDHADRRASMEKAHAVIAEVKNFKVETGD